MIPGESSRTEAVSTKAKYTAVNPNEMGGEARRGEEGGRVDVEGKESGRKTLFG